MFSKKSQTDVKKSVHKILDPKKDTATRFKHLKFLLDNSDENESKHLFENNYSSIYQIFYESFICVETNLKQRVTRIYRDELDTILIILEKILLLCPEIVAQKWQFHSINNVISKLLHPENACRLRRDGIKLFILWYQILGHNAPIIIHTIYSSLIPGFSNSIFEHKELTIIWNYQSNSFTSHDYSSNPIKAAEINVLYPAQIGEKQPDDLDKYYLESLLELMVNQVPRIIWKDLKNCQMKCFNYLFEQFKKFYIPIIFPDYSNNTSIYTSTTELPNFSNKLKNDSNSNCRVIVINWFANYIQNKPNQYSYNITLVSKFMGDKTQLIAFEIVRDTLYKSRENINLIHEIFRQSFLLNFNWTSAIRRTISVYKDWIQLSSSQRPPFMLEPEEQQVVINLDSNTKEILPKNDIRAGFQNVIQLFMSNTLHVFLNQNGVEYPTLLEEQVDTCKRVLNIYRYMVMHSYMTLNTWEKLLHILLRITTIVLKKKPPLKRENTLSGKLAPAIFQTLIVTWIKANLNVQISEKLWDKFLSILCSLTQWEELINEWTKTLETLTRVLAKHVYGLDLGDLPLDRISDKKSRRKRGINTLNLSHTRVSQQSSMIDTQPDNIIKKQNCIRRSNSESEISYYYLFQKCSEPDVLFNITDENCKEEKSSKYVFNIRKSHSLDNLSQFLILQTRDENSRLPSPISTRIDNNFFKESHMQIEIMTSQHSFLDSAINKKSVMSGGETKGWTPDVAFKLWHRMLIALGNVNTLENILLHEKVFQYLLDLNSTMTKIYQNQGLVEHTLVISDLIPSISIIVPWCFHALNLPKNYRNGKLHALKLLCQIILNNRNISRKMKYVIQFFKVLHYGLTSSDQAVVNTILKNTGPKFFSCQLSGYTLLSLDFIHACNKVLSETNILMSPRAEAVNILGCLLSFPTNLTNVPYLKPICNQLITTYCPEIQDKVITILLKVAQTEPTSLARCYALSNLGIYLSQHLSKNMKHKFMKEAIYTLLHALQFNNENISQIACDNLILLCNYATNLLVFYPDIPSKILQALIASLSNMLPIGDRNKRLLISLTFCLAEWTMSIPITVLMELQPKHNLLMTIFMAIDALSRNCNDETIKRLKKIAEINLEYSNEFSFHIALDNIKSVEPKSSNNFSDQFMTPNYINSTRQSLQIANKMIMNHLVNYLDQFPMLIGPEKLGSMISEHDDVLNCSDEQLTTNIFSVPSLQLFMSITDMLIMSIIQLPALEVSCNLTTSLNQIRILMRDLVGKSCWDISPLYCSSNYKYQKDDHSQITKFIHKKNKSNSIVLAYNSNNQIQHTLRHRSYNVLPKFENSADDLDNLDDLLQYISFTSSECLVDVEISLNSPAIKSPLSSQLEQEVMSTIIAQLFIDDNYTNKYSSIENLEKQPQINQHKSPYQSGRALLSELGFTSWDQRQNIYQLERNEKVVRELRVLDNQYCRDTHKIAIIYVGDGQEDKFSIISNTSGSQLYEDFISALAWEVDLETHNGFLGGLQRNKNTGATTPYFSTSFLEVVFHVSTRMPTNSSQESYIQKAKHLGNDEVHIVWSEHSKDYKRGIIPTEFCDVLIAIYPLSNNLFRIQVSIKPEVPYFGPLYNEVIVQKSILANIVRCTALNASRAKRSIIPFYQQYYEERWQSMDMIMKNYKYSNTFEDFITNLYKQNISPFEQPHIRNTSAED